LHFRTLGRQFCSWPTKALVWYMGTWAFLHCMFTPAHLLKILNIQRPMKRFLVPFLLSSGLWHWCRSSSTFLWFFELMIMERVSIWMSKMKEANMLLLLLLMVFSCVVLQEVLLLYIPWSVGMLKLVSFQIDNMRMKRSLHIRWRRLRRKILLKWRWCLRNIRACIQLS